MKNYETIHRELVNRIELLRGMAEEYGEENVALFHCWRGKSTETLRHVTLRIDNSQHRADEVVRRVIDYADCMIEELSQIEDYWSEAHFRGFWEYMDRFIFVVDGERAECNVREVAQGDASPDIRKEGDVRQLSAEALEAKRAQWAALRERILRGERLEVEHLYITEQVPGTGWIDGLPSLLSDLLEGGRLADCVTLQLVEDANDPFDPNSRNAGESQAQRYLWINGLLRGEYVCGEVPFVRDDGLIRSIGSWRQSCHPDDLYSDEGVKLLFAPDTDPALLARAKACALKFKSKLECKVNYVLSPEDYSVDPDDANPHHITNEQVVRFCLERFARIREHFTDAEARQMLDCAVPLQDLMVRHGEGKYAPEEIELYRFGVSYWAMLAAIERIQAELNTREQISAKLDEENRTKYLSRLDPAPTGEILEWPVALQQKAAALPEELRSIPEPPYHWCCLPVCMGDLSVDESWVTGCIYMWGMHVEITNIRLNGLDEVATAQALFDELADIERELRTKDGGSTRPGLTMEEIDQHQPLASSMDMTCLCEVYAQLLPEGAMRKALINPSMTAYKTITNCECLAYMQSTGKCGMETNCLSPQEITFEAQDTGVNARLRFRMEDGRFIHEVAVLE